MNKKIKKNNYVIFFLLLLSIVLKIYTMNFYGDTSLDNEWGILFYNFKKIGVIGINIFNGSEIYMGAALNEEQVLPSVYMPPFYIFLIIFFDYFVPIDHLVMSIITFQIFFSVVASLILLKLLKKIYNKKISYLGFLIFLFLPINIYSVTQISSISLQVFFLIIFFYYYLKIIEKKKNKSIIYFSVISAVLILLRGEFIVLLFFSYYYLFFKSKNLKQIILSMFIILILISPYIYRNLKLFNQITITKSLGYNLWKGNNLYSNVEGSVKLYDDYMINKIKKIKPNNEYEILRDNIYKEEAIKNILINPTHFFYLFLKKVFSLIFFDTNSSYPHYYNPLHLIPKFLIGLTSLLGVYSIVFSKSNLHFYVYVYCLYIILFSIFFILPRYSLAILPIQIILSCSFFNKIFYKFKE